MKIKKIIVCLLTVFFGAVLHLHAQGYIVPNGVVYAGLSLNGSGYGVIVMYNPTNMYYTGFALNPIGKTPPTTAYTNTYRFSPIVDVSVRVFLVSSNQPISQQAIQSGSYTELMYDDYVFNHGSPFYVGLYTGNQNFYPPDGIYSDRLFGWAKLANNRGILEMLDSALVYRAQGIFAGTHNFVPEPSGFALAALGALLFGCRWRRITTS